MFVCLFAEGRERGMTLTWVSQHLVQNILTCARQRRKYTSMGTFFSLEGNIGAAVQQNSGWKLSPLFPRHSKHKKRIRHANTFVIERRCGIADPHREKKKREDIALDLISTFLFFFLTPSLLLAADVICQLPAPRVLSSPKASEAF